MSFEMLSRLIFFACLFAALTGWELAAPRRRLSTSKGGRWSSNLGIILLNSVCLRLLFPLLAWDLAILAAESGWGLLNIFPVPPWMAMVLTILAFDFVIYLQHVVFHTLPILWRLHMMHHADLDIDVTTGLRFHPIEICISMGIKMALVLLIGPPAAAVLAFEIILNATAMFNHGNIFLPLPLDRILRLFVVTPDMHRVHHSVTIRETNSNFGFNLPWWDRLCGTYRAQPAAGHLGMNIGLAQFRQPLGLLRMLVLPFSGPAGSYAIDRRGREPSRPNS